MSTDRRARPSEQIDRRRAANSTLLSGVLRCADEDRRVRDRIRLFATNRRRASRSSRPEPAIANHPHSALDRAAVWPHILATVGWIAEHQTTDR